MAASSSEQVTQEQVFNNDK
ncbi:hypothetical protein CCACVL1_00173 [Corchorus capsularis]|uniref:Uncharacterized protein n=1 Tax=Corchorus capsularis TaxID=210143 RepID=A0A1R3KY61_COCAP|nr:hypothetical protein CCACVL1_00173 [Corchorus capsularis]